MIEFLFDYETLRVIWWVLLGVLLIGFALTDGFDLGSGILLPFVARTDGQRPVTSILEGQHAAQATAAQ